MMNVKVVNITSAASGKGLKEEIETQAAKRGMKIRTFIGQLFAYAVNNKSKFRTALKNVRPKGGALIGSTVSEDVKNKLDEWAKRKRTDRGLLCCFIIEKIFEDNLIEDVFSDENGPS